MHTLLLFQESANAAEHLLQAQLDGLQTQILDNQVFSSRLILCGSYINSSSH